MTCPLCNATIESFADVGKLIDHILSDKHVGFAAVQENQDSSKETSPLRRKGRQLYAKSQKTLAFRITKNAQGVVVEDVVGGFVYQSTVFEEPLSILFWQKTVKEGVHCGAVLVAQKRHPMQWQLKTQ